MCRFSDAGIGERATELMRPASEKRQGTKSREVGQRRRSGRYGDLAADGVLESWECDRAPGSIEKLCMSEWIRSLQPMLNNEGSCIVWEDSWRFARARAWPVENRRKQRARQRRDLGVIVMRCRS